MFSTVILACISLALVQSAPVTRRRTPILLISFDGYRADYLDKFLRENPQSYLQKLFVEVGVKADYMVPSFPSLTFPNHYALVTGQYMETHGIVGNTFYDPNYKEKVNLLKDSKGTDKRFWNSSEPIWLSAKRQGLKTGSFFWTGSEVWGQHPDVFISYNPTIAFETRCDEVVNWFDKFDMDFVTLYFNEPDHTGHDTGPDSKEYWEKIVAVDKLVGVLMSKLEARGSLLDKINILVVSDHGMADVTKNIALKHDLIDTAKSSFGIVSLIYPKKNTDLEKIYTDLKENTENVDVYLREEVPERLHFRNNPRIAPIVVVAHEGFGVTLGSNILKGNHGYDNKYESMRAIFLARGPDFKLNQRLGPINNVDVYPLVCHLLDIKCQSNNGTLSNFDQVLVNKPVKLM